MPFKFNPFTGNFDQTGSGGGGSSYIDGEEATYNDLSLDAGVAPLNSAWLVRNSSGIWPFNKPGGIYIRTATGGSSRDADYTYAGTMPDVFSDAVLTIYDEASTTRTGQFNLGSVTAGQNRVLTWPNASGTIARTEDFASPPAIGNTTPAAGTFTQLASTSQITGANATAGPPTTTGQARGLQFALLGGTVGNTAGIYGSYAGTSTLGIGIANGSAGSITQVAAFTSTGLNSCAIGSTTPAAVSATTLNATGTTELVNGGTTAGPFRLYNQSTSATNFERGKFAWESNVLRIGTEKGSAGGTARALEFQTDGVTRMTVGATGNAGIGASPSTLEKLIISQTAGFQHRAIRVVSGTETAGGFARLGMFGNISNAAIGSFALNLSSDSAGATTRDDATKSGWSFVFDNRAATDQFRINYFNGTDILPFQLSSLGRATFQYNGNNSTGDARLNVYTDSSSVVGQIIRGAASQTANLLECQNSGSTVLASISSAGAGSLVGLTLTGNLTISTKDIVTDTTTGTKIGTATTQKLGFFNATPVVQQAAIADATDAATTQARLNDLLATMRTFGLIAT